MFDLDEIEKNWQEYYRTKYGKDHLSNIDILDIYKSENATQEYYDNRRDEYDEKFRKLWKIVHEDYNPFIDYSRAGLDEDISNIDKDEFLREYEEFKDMKYIYREYRDEEYDRDDDILIQLRAEDRFDFSKLHENDDDFLSGSDVDPADFGVDKDFVPHDPSYYIDDDVLEIDELDYDYNGYDYKKIKEFEARKRNIASRIIMEKALAEDPKKIILSTEKQKLVVEGCMHLVFEQTRYWDEALGHVFNIEELYYICLTSLIRAANCCHYRMPVFPRLVNEAIRIKMYDLIARRMHLTYRELYEKIDNYELRHKPTGPDDHQLYDIPSKPTFLVPTDPKDIYLMIKDIPSEDEYEKDSDAFMEAYYQELSKLKGLEKYVLSMAYNTDGFPGLTNAEIADNLMIDVNAVSSLKKKALTKLRKKDSIKK